MKILIAEDDAVSRRLVESLVAPFGEVELAIDGQEALDIFEDALDSQHPFDLVLLDIMMPNIDGQDVLAIIRDLEELNGVAQHQSVKVIMLSSLEDGHNIYEAHAHGCTNYLVKPVSRERLLRALSNLKMDNEASD